ncbi:peroxiredoxin [Candidatus Parcubacteria bacterium]|nr:MAG: peroxiredoxin [Candidatus Parcubacteria bacterium]
MIQIGKPAPNFENIVAYQKGSDDFKKISLSDYKGKWLIFFMYPRDFTFVCPTELRGFAKHQADFKELGAEILAGSTDSEWSHKAWFEKDLPEVEYPILADTTQSVARDYQILNEDDGSAERGLFIIDPEGIVRYIVVSAGSVGRSVTETLRVLKAIQSGELCPVEWKPGQETLGKA